MNLFSDLGIGKRLYGIIIVLLLVACSIITTINNIVARDSLEQQLLDVQLPAIMENIAAEVDKQILEPTAGLSVMAFDPFFIKWIEDGEPKEQLPMLYKQLREMAGFYGLTGSNFVSWKSKDYFSLFKGEEGHRRVDPAKDAWFAKFKDSGKKVGINVYTDHPDFGTIAFINSRINGTNNDFLGITSAAIQLNDFVERVTSMVVGEKGITYMISDDGVVRVHQDRTKLNQANIKNVAGFDKVASQLLSSKEYSFEYENEEGETYYVITKFIPELGWHLVAEASKSELFAGMTRALWITILTSALLVLLGVGVGIFFVRSIVSALQAGVVAADAISRGDLTHDVKATSNDEIGQLMQAMRRMSGQLKQVVLNVQGVASYVAGGSEELTASSQVLADGANSQASSVEQVSSSMEEIGSSIQQNTENAVETRTIATKAATDADKGGASIAETVDSMQQIAEKISIVEEIARQTNLLALNAAIEAARAGEHGKGFAVVAAEVRKLAERSGQAAGEISELSSQSVRVAEEAGSMFKQLVPDIQKTAELVDEIASASSEQNAGAGQINESIQLLDRVVQQNAAGSEEVASTSKELASRAEELIQAISFFQLGTNERPGGFSAPAPTVKVAKAAPKPLTATPAASAAPADNGVSIDMGGDDEDFERF